MLATEHRKYTLAEHMLILESALARRIRLWDGPNAAECAESMRLLRVRRGLPEVATCRVCLGRLDPFLVGEGIVVHMTCEFPP